MTIPETPVHIKCRENDIAKIVIMPGDPLRAKYIAENFLEQSKLVTSVRNMLGYTGTYKGTKVTVMGSGMGMPSMSIYAFELFKYFNVEKIIRIGTCGGLVPEIDVPEVILANLVYSQSNFAYQYNGYLLDTVKPSEELNKQIKKVAKEKNINLHVGTLMTCDVFGPYVGFDNLIDRIPQNIHPLGEEMEAFALVHVANSLKKQATCLATVVNSKYSDKVLTIEERETKLNEMILLALDSIIIP